MNNLTAYQKEIQDELLKRELSRAHFLNFVQYVSPSYNVTWFHRIYAQIIHLFAKGIIKKLIVSVPPQHGKSELSSRKLPAYMLGKNPDLNIAIASYSTTFARKFNVDTQRIIADPLYYNLFPNTTIPKTKFSQKSEVSYTKTKDEVEVINHKGVLRSVGRGGALTGTLVDIMLMDDLYKDYAEGNSPVVREAVIDWYIAVVRSRLHNNSQQLIVFTRWHEEDLIGWIEVQPEENVIELVSLEQLEPKNIDYDSWYKINFPALSTQSSIENELDERIKKEEALWPERHNTAKLKNDRALDPEKFESLDQGDPKPRVGLLYSNGFNTYTVCPTFKMTKFQVDSKDQGTDYCCAVAYGVGLDDYIYILDVYYSNGDLSEIENETAELILSNRVLEGVIESNSGGYQFARNIDRITKNKLYIETKFQQSNKESRIISNSAQVQKRILFPVNWTGKWPAFSKAVLNFKKNFKANTNDDAPDCLTGVLENSGVLDDWSALYEM